MIYLKTDEEIELLRESNLLVGMTLGDLAKWIAPGITTLKLDKIAEEFIRDHGAVPGFWGMVAFRIRYVFLLMNRLFMEFRRIMNLKTEISFL